MPDRLEHRQIGRGVAVGVTAFEVVALGHGQFPDRLGLGRAIGVVLHLAGEAAVLADGHARRHHPVGAEQFTDGLHHLGARGRHDHHVPPGRVVLLDEGGGLVVDDRVDEVVQRLGDDLADLLHVPAAAQGGQVLAHALHLVVIQATGQEDELGICGTQRGPAVDQPALVEGLAEGERARLRNDRLVQVKEGCCAGQGVVFHAPEHRRPPFGVRWGAWVCLRGLSGTPWKSRIVRDRANPARLLPPESAVGTTPALPPGGGRRMSGWVLPLPPLPSAAAAMAARRRDRGSGVPVIRYSG